jgi:hypothetical protein
MYLALLAGTNPKTLMLNRSNKQTDELEAAIQNGLCMNIDAADELERIGALCRRRHRHPAEARSRSLAGPARGRHARSRDDVPAATRSPAPRATMRSCRRPPCWCAATAPSDFAWGDAIRRIKADGKVVFGMAGNPVPPQYYHEPPNRPAGRL